MSSIQVAGPPWKGVSISGCKISQISFQTSLTDRPNAHGCFVPRMGAYASLYKEQNCGPHQSSCGNRLVTTKPTIIRRLGDQVSMGPIGVCDQSLARIRSPISPPVFI